MDGQNPTVDSSLQCKLCGMQFHSGFALETHDEFTHWNIHKLCEAILDYDQGNKSLAELYDAKIRIEKHYVALFCDTDLRLYGGQS